VREIAPEGQGARRLVRVMIGTTAFGLLISLVAIPMHAPARFVGIALLLFGTGAAGATFLWLWLRNSRLLLGAGQVGLRDAFGRDQLWPRRTSTACWTSRLIYTRNAASQRAVYVISNEGRRLAILGVQPWGTEAIGEFARATGKQLEVSEQPISAKDFRKEFPHAMSWASVHPTLISRGLHPRTRTRRSGGGRRRPAVAEPLTELVGGNPSGPDLPA